MNEMRVAEYITWVLTQGRYTVSLSEIEANVSGSHKAVLQSLYRLKQKKRIVQLRKTFYGIIPPHYASMGTIPGMLFIDDLMQFLQKKYYVAFYSAAALHGAAHQQPMSLEIITEPPAIRPVYGQKQMISFFTKTNWPAKGIEPIKNEAGYVQVSGPALTLFDLIRYHRKLGGLSRMVPVLDELTDEVNVAQFNTLARKASTATLQRLGYMLQILEKGKLTNSVFHILQHRKTQQIPLSLAHAFSNGHVNNQWNIVVNKNKAGTDFISPVSNSSVYVDSVSAMVLYRL